MSMISCKRILALAACLMCLAGTALAVDPLPIDFSPGPVPDASRFTEDSYEDESISVHMERIWVDECQFHVAHVTIADASQLRTALAAPFGKNKTNRVSTIARDHNAVVATGGDYYGNEEGGYVVRMGETGRKKPLKSRDMLVIDGNGDFHILIHSDSEQLRALVESDIPIVNVFNFGPALVCGGELQAMPEKYQYNIKGREPRCAIGQTGPLSYVMVVADGRGAGDSKGCSVETLARVMADLGCLEAYNLDGGGSALMYFGGENYSTKSFKAERSVSDIIYFATAVESPAESGEE